MRRYLALVCFLFVGAFIGSWCSEARGAGVAGGGIAALAQATLKPGETIKIDDPATKGSGYWMLYVPSDYVATRKWPVIFCFHGLGLEPTVWPFKDATSGKGYIVVGMEYIDRVGHDGGDPTATANVPNLKRIHDALSQKLSIDEHMQFIGGFSQGGFKTIAFSDATIDTWAGILIFSAGRAADGSGPNLKGKPVFVGAGDSDPNNTIAHDAATYYKAHGADVTMEVFAKTGHSINTSDSVLKQWLLDHGPLMVVKQIFSKAQALEKAGKKGSAYASYQEVIQQDQPGDMTDQATKSIAAMEADAAKISADAEADLSSGKFSDGFKKFLSLSQMYSGSALGDKAAARLAALRADPAISAELAQAAIDASADQAEARAAGEEKSGDYKSAIAGYQAYITAFPKSHRIAQVRAHLKILQDDPAIQAKITSTEPEKNCKKWLSLADSYIENGDDDHARQYLQKIIDQYPDTTWAQTAKDKLKAMQ